MEIQVNGEPRTLETPTTLGALVDGEVPDRRGVAAAIDGEIVSRANWDATPVTEGAQVEILAAVQGG